MAYAKPFLNESDQLTKYYLLVRREKAVSGIFFIISSDPDTISIRGGADAIETSAVE